MVIRRGELWWSDLPDPIGSEPGFARPVVIVQSDRLNEAALRTVLVVPLYSNLRYADAFGNVLLTARESGLPKDSVANVSQLFVVDRSRLREPLGRLSARKLRELDNGLRLALEL